MLAEARYTSVAFPRGEKCGYLKEAGQIQLLGTYGSRLCERSVS